MSNPIKTAPLDPEIKDAEFNIVGYCPGSKS